MASLIKLKRSATDGKRPTLAQIELGEIALNTYNGYLFTERDTGGVGIGTTVSLLTPWVENFGAASIYYDNAVGIGTTDPDGAKLNIVGGGIKVSGVSTFSNNVIIDSTGYIQIPVGDSSERPTGVGVTLGQIRYNSQLSTFEGYGAGNAWGSLGGVKDVDGDTYIIPENSPGSDEDILYFYSGGTNTVQFSSTSAQFDVSLDVNASVDISTNLNVVGVTTLGSVKIDSGIVTATSGIVTYHGDQVIGTPTGGSFRAGAYTPTATDLTKDSIDELNYILDKLVPPQPTTIDGVSLSLTGTAGSARLCAGFTPTNNTNDAAPVAGNQYTRNSDNTITTNYLTDYGPGDSGTLTGYVNTVGVGTTTFNVSFGIYAAGNNAGTTDAIQIANNTDAADSLRDTEIDPLFYEVYDVRLINAASPDGYNEAYITHGSATTNSVYWYEDPSVVSAPVITFGSVNVPSSPVLSYSSRIPHYTNNVSNAFNYDVNVENASGDMYISNTLLDCDNNSTNFTEPGDKTYVDFGGTNPPTRNYGVGTPVSVTVHHEPEDVHATVTSNHFSSWDVSTPYGSHNNQTVSYTTPINIMGTTGRPNQIDEDSVLIGSSLGAGTNGTRTQAGSGDNPTPIYTSWYGGSAGSLDTYEAVVRGGTLRHDETDYSLYLPSGPDLSDGSRSGAQYYQIEFIRSALSGFSITVVGSYDGCWVCMPDNSNWTTGLSNTNGWADMFVAAPASGVPRNGNDGCSSGGAMNGSSGTFACVFGTESSTNDTNNRILVRFKLTSGQSITSMSFA